MPLYMFNNQIEKVDEKSGNTVTSVLKGNTSLLQIRIDDQWWIFTDAFHIHWLKTVIMPFIKPRNTFNRRRNCCSSQTINEADQRNTHKLLDEIIKCTGSNNAIPTSSCLFQSSTKLLEYALPCTFPWALPQPGQTSTDQCPTLTKTQISQCTLRMPMQLIRMSHKKKKLTVCITHNLRFHPISVNTCNRLSKICLEPARTLIFWR